MSISITHPQHSPHLSRSPDTSLDDSSSARDLIVKRRYLKASQTLFSLPSCKRPGELLEQIALLPAQVLSITDEKGNILLHSAFHVLSQLKNQRHKLDAEHYQVLYSILHYTCDDLIQKIQPDQTAITDSSGFNVFMLACLIGEDSHIQKLLMKSLQHLQHFSATGGYTALHCAVQAGRSPAIIHAIASKMSSIRQEDHAGNTVFDLAKDSPEILAVLYEINDEPSYFRHRIV